MPRLLLRDGFNGVSLFKGGDVCLCEFNQMAKLEISDCVRGYPVINRAFAYPESVCQLLACEWLAMFRGVDDLTDFFAKVVGDGEFYFHAGQHSHARQLIGASSAVATIKESEPRFRFLSAKAAP